MGGGVSSINFLTLLKSTIKALTPVSRQPINVFGQEYPKLPEVIVMQIMQHVAVDCQSASSAVLVNKTWFNFFSTQKLRPKRSFTGNHYLSVRRDIFLADDLQEGYSYRLMLNATDVLEERELGFYIVENRIVAKLQGEDDFPIPESDEMYKLIIEASKREVAKGWSYRIMLEQGEKPKENEILFEVVDTTVNIPGLSESKIYESNGVYFIERKVIGDGDCGYTAFGITREKALKLITDNIISIREILRLPIEEQLLDENFIAYLKQYEIPQEVVTIFDGYQKIVQEGGKMPDAVVAKLLSFATDLVVIQAYINYDIRDRKIDAGWTHPRVLQALAHIQEIELYIWQSDKPNHLIPHQEELYRHYVSPVIEHPQKTIEHPQKTDLLFVNGNHFNLLERQPASFIAQEVVLQNRAALVKAHIHGEQKPISIFDEKISTLVIQAYEERRCFNEEEIIELSHCTSLRGYTRDKSFTKEEIRLLSQSTLLSSYTLQKGNRVALCN